METYRLVLLIVVMALCITDLILTAYYINKYKQWQPNKPYKDMELNPLLVFLWEKLGFITGMLIASVILLTLNFIIARDGYVWLVVILICSFAFAMYNHINNLTLLHKLIEQYPTGHLPESIFGVVTGNN